MQDSFIVVLTLIIIFMCLVVLTTVHAKKLMLMTFSGLRHRATKTLSITIYRLFLQQVCEQFYLVLINKLLNTSFNEANLIY
jgi:hypothetical protein